MILVVLAAVGIPAGTRATDDESDRSGPPSWLRRADWSAGEIVSPGALATAHNELEGVSKCASCHAALEATPDARCLECHESIGERMAARTGWHGRFDERCASCHVDHRGADADLLGLDREAFNHELAEWPLRGAHVAVACIDCHQQPGENGALRFQTLGFPHARCADCHADPHADPFPPGGDCADCHGEVRFASSGLVPAGFDHDRDTAFTLTGRHQGLACASCHTQELRELERTSEVAPGSGAQTACRSCHEDPHRARLGSDCTSCHDTNDWAGPEAPFVHSTHTEFALDATHAPLPCAACHEDAGFSAPGVTCVECHSAEADLLAGRFEPDFVSAPDPHAAETACADCHSPAVRASLLSNQRACLTCHPTEYASLLGVDIARRNDLVLRVEASLDRMPETPAIADPAARIARIGAHHPELAEQVLIHLLEQLDAPTAAAGQGEAK